MMMAREHPRTDQPEHWRCPLFPFIGDGLLRQLDAASLSITKARETVAAYAYEEHLAAVPPPPGDVAGAGQR